MGQNMHLARYPVHWHVLGEGQGQYIENSAIHDTYSRCVTVHGTNDLRIQNNVTFNTVGHCFFLEDGIEHGNQLVHNLAIQTKCHPTKPCMPVNIAPNGEVDHDYANRAAYNRTAFAAKETLLPSDNTVSSFWITNPDNSFVDNVAAGSDQIGFWLSLPEHPQGAFKDAETAKRVAAKLREDNFKVEESVTRKGGGAPAASAPTPPPAAAAAKPDITADQYDVLVSGQTPEELNKRLAAKGLAAEAASGGMVVKPSLPLRDAVALSKDLAVEGFKVQVRRAGGSMGSASPAPAPAAATPSEGGSELHRVRVGGFADRAAALDVVRQLEAKGYKPYIARGDQ